MNDELTNAVIAALRADTTIGPAVGGRIYPASQVPPDAPFPRCYVGYRPGGRYIRYPRGQGFDRHALCEVRFATTVTKTPEAAHSIEVWDRTAWPIVEQVTATNLVLVQRIGDIPPVPQTDDRNTYVVGGGLYDCYFQEG